MTKPMLQPSFVAGPLDDAASVGAWAASLIEAALAGDQDVVRKAGSTFAQTYQGADRQQSWCRSAPSATESRFRVAQDARRSRLAV